MTNVNFKCKVTEEVFDLELPLSCLIAEAKRNLEAKVSTHDLAMFDQKWIFQGRVLKDADTLEQSGIREGLCVHVMKTAKAATTSVASPAPSTATTATAPSFVPVPAFDQGMYMLLSNEEAQAKEAIILLLKIISNVIDKPLEEKYRKVKASSKAFTKLEIKGGKECMSAMGFNLSGEEYVLTPSAQAWEVLIACQSKLDRFMARYIETKEKESGASTTTTTTTDTATGDGGNGSDEKKSSPQDEQAMAAAMQLMLSAMMSQQQGQTGQVNNADSGGGGGRKVESSSSSSSSNEGGDGESSS